jgi:hypothetical protein
MHNFDFLKKKELSYILNNEEEFGAGLIAQIEEYCQRKGYQKLAIKASIAEWDDSFSRLNVGVQGEDMLISKTKIARESDVNKYSFGLIAVMGLVLIFIILLVNKEENYTEKWFMLLALPFLAFFLYELIKQRSETKKNLEQSKEISISKSWRVCILANQSKVFEEKIKAVNLFWTQSEEAGSKPTVLLELSLVGGKVVDVDRGINYLELLKCGNEIARFLNRTLNVFYGDSPRKDRVEL